MSHQLHWCPRSRHMMRNSGVLSAVILFGRSSRSLGLVLIIVAFTDDHRPRRDGVFAMSDGPRRSQESLAKQNVVPAGEARNTVTRRRNSDHLEESLEMAVRSLLHSTPRASGDGVRGPRCSTGGLSSDHSSFHWTVRYGQQREEICLVQDRILRRSGTTRALERPERHVGSYSGEPKRRRYLQANAASVSGGVWQLQEKFEIDHPATCQ